MTMVAHEESGSTGSGPRRAVSHLRRAADALNTLRPFPNSIARIRAAANHPSTSVAQLAVLTEGDVGFATRVLRLVNSPIVGMPQRCTSVRHAVAVLGTRRVAELATAAVAAAFIEAGAVTAPRIAAHAVATGCIARVLAHFAGLSPDEAFTAGLLHDAGALLLAQSGDEGYKQLLAESAAGEEPVASAEQVLLGFDHAALGAEAIRRWKLPTPLPEAVELHHDWEAASRLGHPVTPLVAMIRIADLLAPRVTERTQPDESDLRALRAEPSVAALALSPEEIHRMWPRFRDAIQPLDDALDRAVMTSTRAARTSEPQARPRSATWIFVGSLLAVGGIAAAVAVSIAIG